MACRIVETLSFLSFRISRPTRQFWACQSLEMTTIRWWTRQLLVAFRRESHSDDAFSDTAVPVDAEDANVPNAEEAEVADHDMLNAVTVQQMADRHSHEYHRLRETTRNNQTNHKSCMFSRSQLSLIDFKLLIIRTGRWRVWY